MWGSLTPPHSAALGAIVAAARRRGNRAYLVGGAVRDGMLGLPTGDLDVSIEGAADKVVADLERRDGAVIVAHSQFATWKIGLGGCTVDVVTARSETYSVPGALPVITPGDIGGDLRRRDFTVNSMAADLLEGGAAALRDPLRGRRDLDAKLIRINHDNSFVDDPTRIMRALMYKARLGFELEPNTAARLRDGIGGISGLSPARAWAQLHRWVLEPRAGTIFGLGQDLGVLSAIHPRFKVPESALAAMLSRTGLEERLELLFSGLSREALAELHGISNLPRAWREGLARAMGRAAA